MWIVLGLGLALYLLSRSDSPLLGGGSGGTPALSGDPLPTKPCHLEASDGPWKICVWREVIDGDVRWSWRAWRTGPWADATDDGPKQATGSATFDTSDDARFDAWTKLYEIQKPVNVVPAPADRFGMKLAMDGTVLIVDEQPYLNFAMPVISTQSQQGETGLGLVVAVLLEAWPTVNPLRFRPADGTLEAAGQRVTAVGAPNPPAVARAIFGL